MDKVHIVTDISYGDAGKGTTVDYLARQADSAVVIRHSGGAQAAHNVVTPDGRHHTFAQFGSGSFVPQVRTHLSQFMMVSPTNMLWEADHLIGLGVFDIWNRLTIDKDAPVILPWHKSANKLRELSRGDAPHGSTGMGIGEVQMDLLERPETAVHVRDLLSPKTLRDQLLAHQAAKFEQLRVDLHVPDSDDARKVWGQLQDTSVVDDLLGDLKIWLRSGLEIVDGSQLQELADSHESLIFEGSQGVLLDEWYGFHPYTTWSTTTSENALKLLDGITHDASVTRLGVMRAYTTRHGYGPFVSEDATLATTLTEDHNGTGKWMGAFRYGHLDLVAHEYAIAANGGVDELVVTGMDRSNAWKYCTEYDVPPAADLATFFRLTAEKRVNSIQVGVQGDLDYQARLTELLFSCTPRYQTPCTVDGDTLLSVIEGTLGVSVGLASYGPTAIDKRVLSV